MILRSVEIGRSLRGTGSEDRDPGLCSQGIIAGIIASVQERDDRWFGLTMDQLGVSDSVLRDYVAHGDSVLLANWIPATRPLFRLCLEDIPNMAYHLRFVLPRISGFDIQNSLPGLQHDFCALWNEITRKARKRRSDHISYFILRPIRHLYIALHQGTDAAPTAFSASTGNYDDILYEPSSYPLCNLPDHASHSHSETSETTRTYALPDTVLNTNIPRFLLVIRSSLVIFAPIDPRTRPDTSHGRL